MTIRTRNLPAGEVGEFGYQPLPAVDYVLIEVEDTGTGMTAEVQAKIFEPFFSTKEVGKGTGLGLSTVYGIVKQTGAHIFFDSDARQGHDLPHLRAAPHPGRGREGRRPPASRRPRSPTSPARATILLVEDEEAVRAFAARALASRGYKVLEAASGVEALEVMQEAGGKVDLVVSDVVMPELDGPSLLARAAQDAAGPEDHLRLRLRRGRLREEPPGGRELPLPAEAVLAQAARRGGEGNARAVGSDVSAARRIARQPENDQSAVSGAGGTSCRGIAAPWWRMPRQGEVHIFRQPFPIEHLAVASQRKTRADAALEKPSASGDADSVAARAWRTTSRRTKCRPNRLLRTSGEVPWRFHLWLLREVISVFLGRLAGFCRLSGLCDGPDAWLCLAFLGGVANEVSEDESASELAVHQNSARLRSGCPAGC